MVACRLDGRCSLRKFWNYLRRQLYVMDTYASAFNRRQNHGMLALHCYLSWGIVVPAAISACQLARCYLKFAQARARRRCLQPHFSPNQLACGIYAAECA
jgi:hypothetical protein